MEKRVLLERLEEALDFLREAVRIVREQGAEVLAERFGLSTANPDALAEQLARQTASLIKTGHLAFENTRLMLAVGVEAELANGRVYVKMPYYPSVLDELRKFGRWDAGARRWVFSEEDLMRLERLMQETFGQPGEPRVTVRMRVGGGRQAIYAMGRLIVERPFRDAHVKLGPGVVIVEGGFPSRGGSIKHPRLAGEAVVEVRQVPLSVARRFVEHYGDAYEAELLETSNPVRELETRLQEVEVQLEELQRERNELQSRLQALQAREANPPEL